MTQIVVCGKMRSLVGSDNPAGQLRGSRYIGLIFSQKTLRATLLKAPLHLLSRGQMDYAGMFFYYSFFVLISPIRDPISHKNDLPVCPPKLHEKGRQPRRTHHFHRSYQLLPAGVPSIVWTLLKGPPQTFAPSICQALLPDSSRHHWPSTLN